MTNSFRLWISVSIYTYEIYIQRTEKCERKVILQGHEHCVILLQNTLKKDVPYENFRIC